MNTSVSPPGAPPPPSAPAAAVPAPNVVREGFLDTPTELVLHHGGRVTGLRIAWRLVGPAGAPVICALGGIGCDRRICLTEDPRQSWWQEVAGPGRALDTTRLAVLGFDYLGSGQSTSPSSSVSSYDQAEVLLRLLNHLGIGSLRAIIGGSYGGMVALAFGERSPDRVAQLIVVSAADRTHPLATAWRSVQRRIVRLGLEAGRPEQALQLAGALAMATRRSAEEFAARFAGEPVSRREQHLFAVEQDLLARGAAHMAGQTPHSFLTLSESIDLHRVDATRIFVSTTAVAVREDQLVPPADIRALVARLPRAHLCEVSSLHGHDAFLRESEQWRALFAPVLGPIMS